MELRQEMEYTDQTKMIEWLLSTKHRMLDLPIPALRNPHSREILYDAIAEISLTIEKFITKVEK